jgi:5-methylcytosine-specific restriction enzyme A
MCLKEGYLRVADVADHIQPHNNNKDLFWNGELQSLCKLHHDSIKQRIEKTGRYNPCDINGKPLDIL